MALTDAPAATEPPRGHVKVVYLGPVAPHWEIRSDFGERNVIDEFRTRTLARLLLLPPHDPQFRRNRERVVRDAERENLVLEWDLGLPEDDAPPAAAAEAAPAADDEDASAEAEAAGGRRATEDAAQAAEAPPA
jgi:hypothetical protein